MSLNFFKDQFNQNSKYIHFNNSGQAPIPLAYKNKVIEWIERFYSEAAFASVEGWEKVDETRHLLAQFLGADASEVSFFQTTASALSQAAFSIPLKRGEQILTWDQEYPSNFYPWRIAAEKTGSEVVQLVSDGAATPAEKLIAAITPQTKVIAISWVQFTSGAVTDLEKISQAVKGQNIWLVTDAIQALGVRPFDFKKMGFDIVCCGSHKWMCSGYGASFMIVKKERLEELTPIEYGAMTYGTPDTPKSFSIGTKKSAIKFEPGSKSMIEIIAMAETLKLFQSTGMQNIFNEAERLTGKLRDGVSDLGYETQSPKNGCILNFKAQNEELTRQLAGRLKGAGVSYALRGGGIRLSLHGFNRDTEVDKVLKTLSEA
ncbi:MAG: aminotransferase class V-fold PLP-dependent enzyme [Pseudobdellovibrio sp.]